MKTYKDKVHFYGRITNSVAILLFIAYPLFVSIYYNAFPCLNDFLGGMLGVAPIFWTVSIIEALTFPPMLGTGGTYIGFITGNLTSLKVPAAINALEAMKAEAATEEGEVISTLAIAVSSIVTILIIFFGVVLLNFLQPILQSPVLKPAFDNILPALFGGLAVVFFNKNFKIAIAPCVLMIVLFVLFPQLASAVSLMVPAGAVFTIIISRILYKMKKI